MEIRFRNDRLDRLETQAGDGGFPREVVKAYRKRVQHIRAAKDERDLYGMKSLHYEKLKGDREHQHSVRLNDQWRLILEIQKRPDSGDPVVVIVEIVDYH